VAHRLGLASPWPGTWLCPPRANQAFSLASAAKAVALSFTSTTSERAGPGYLTARLSELWVTLNCDWLVPPQH
jgi:hypothetical protein